jgi:hypothetical protein
VSKIKLHSILSFGGLPWRKRLSWIHPRLAILNKIFEAPSEIPGNQSWDEKARFTNRGHVESLFVAIAMVSAPIKRYW